ncbi:uncharacterized protein MELLADRAFT_65027 [Melampsora larici-populina 98AG31]|uniref:Uncharacterized protein n=1 Tax=Melampsora larici-populina (strain 98AG31 / pathotype 3-4-7) TaxID=747676 RepID=F4RTQ5_MELLP|nr:uncharacterized protein MELLADRAFT_65027 [Melampsora larici-populina 98AG31]EGG04222.1 hypothetical protein MELLADRAFT_65027 [Melampsora larici-populina 98AG31]
MAEGSVANLRSRVLRSNTASQDIEKDRTKSKKRAKPIEEAPFEKVVDDKVCASVQDVVNSKAPSEAPRGNLLKLLDQHIIKKKARTSKKSSQKKTVKQSRRPIRERPPISPSKIDHTFAPRPQDVDYDQYTDQQLRELVGDVGLDADGLPRTELVKTCKTYQDLIVLPPVLPSFTFRKSRHAPLEGRSTPDETTDSGKGNVPIAVLAVNP